MPVPKPKAGEKQDKFISRCMRFMAGEGGRPRKQQVAICFDSWRSARKKVDGPLKKYFETMRKVVG